VRGVVQSHVDEIFVNPDVSIVLLVFGVLRLLDLRECIFCWIGENLLLDLVEVGGIIELVQSIKVGVRLEQIIAPSSLGEFSKAKLNVTNAKAEELSRPDIPRTYHYREEAVP
jgi:hypothetical protein